MELHGFKLVKSDVIPELNTRALLYEHLRTGARLLSMENDDENKVFGITFRTPPPDSTGLPHIMEHSVLCGSRKYPVKEPFVELMKGSLHTFLNAMTFPDKTCYPIASQNVQDFYNLMDVYMDAVLYPLISPQTLQQEGWHFELEEVNGPLTYKGVVFNEMKGAYSSPDSLLVKHTQESLFPDHVYGVDSGGDPKVIPDLTYAQFTAFHQTFYHPSNAYIYFYGDDDPEERLRRMEVYLKDYTRIPIPSQVGRPYSFPQPRKFEFGYDPGEDNNAPKAMLVVNWVLDDTTNKVNSLALNILAYILIGTPASPLRKTLIDSGLGEDLAGGGLEEDLLQMYFSTGLKGIQGDNAAKVESLVLDTLNSLVKNGIDSGMITAAVNTVEFRLRENNTGAYPRGLLLMLRALSTWLYEDDPVKSLAFEGPLNALKTGLDENPRFFEDLIEKYFMQNTHRTTVLLRPEAGLNQKDERIEQERLANIKAAMSQAELLKVQADAQELKRRQEMPDSPESLATIPSLKLADIDKESKKIPIDVSEWYGSNLLNHDLFTNGIVYLDLGFDLHCLPQDYLPLVTLFGRSLLEMGTETQDFVALSQRIGSTTGGIRPVSFTSAVRGQKGAIAWLFLRGKSTMTQSKELLAVLKDILLTVRLDNRERFRQMVLEEKADQEAGLVPAGHRVVNTRLRARFSESGWAAEQMGGVNYLFFLRQLANDVEMDWPGVLAKLEAMRSLLITRQGLLSNVTLDAKNWALFQPDLKAFISALPKHASLKSDWVIQLPTHPEGLAIPAQVNYVGKGANLFDLDYQLDGSIGVITNYMHATYLWERVRVQGGAYGGFCVFDPRSGVFTYLSYRDPNLIATLDNYDGAGVFLSTLDEGRLNSAELAKSIIGAIGDLDAYQLPDAKGYTSMMRYLLDESDDYRQHMRDEVLSTSLEDFRQFGQVLERVASTGQVIILGSQDALRSANEKKGDWLVVEKVL